VVPAGQRSRLVAAMRRTLLSCLCAAGLALSSVAAQEGAVLAAVTAAEKASEEKRGEDAVVALQEAERLLSLVRDPDVRAELGRTLAAARAAHDPIADAVDEGRAAAAAALAEAATAYEEKGWYRMALTLLREAAGFSAASVADAIARVQQALLAARAEGAGGSGLMSWFDDGEVVQGRDGWSIEDGVLLSPEPTPNADGGIFIGSVRARPDQLRFAATATMTGTGGFGLVFAYRHNQDYHLAYCSASGSDTYVRLLRWRNGAYQELAETQTSPAKTRLPKPEGAPADVASYRLEVRVDGDRIEFQVGQTTLRAKSSAPIPRGFFGFENAHLEGTKAGFAPVFVDVEIDAEVAR
jgi:hypothetical protein